MKRQTEETYRNLLLAASDAQQRAYAPYSRYFVGAALLTAGGKVYTGCNIENAAYSPTNCAERTAFFKAVSEGEREFTAIAVVGGAGGENDGTCTPCGVCRQVMAEFCGADFRIVLGTPEHFSTFALSELLPASFGLKN